MLLDVSAFQATREELVQMTAYTQDHVRLMVLGQLQTIGFLQLARVGPCYKIMNSNTQAACIFLLFMDTKHFHALKII